MNILYIAHTRDGSGARVALENMAKGMIAKGHNVFVMSPALDCKLSDNMRKIGATVLVAPVSMTVYPNVHNPIRWIGLLLRNIIRWQKAKRIILDTIVNNKIDIVHTNVGPMNIAPPVCRKLGIPHVWHIREFQKEFFLTFFWTPSLFKKVIKQKGNYNIAITKSIFQYHSLRDNIDRVIYDGVFPKNVAENQYTKQQRKKVVLFVGRVEEAKGTLDLIQAFVKFQLEHPEWKLLVVGAYNEHSQYYQSCKKISAISKNIEFLGKRADVYELMREARVLVMSSKREGFGFVTAEAMANGCLVIGRNTAGTKEQLDNGADLTGGEIALRYDNQDELLKQLENAADHDYSDMQERAKKAVVELYSLENASDKIENYYKWIMKDYYGK